MKSPLKNPLIFGQAAAGAVVIFNVGIAALAEGSLGRGFSVFTGNGLFTYLVPMAVGAQMGLFRYHRNLTAEKRLHGPEKAGVSGSIASSAAMVACCLHHVSDALSAFGFLLAASSFLGTYKDAIIVIGLAVNVLGSGYILNAVLKDRKLLAGKKEKDA